MSIAVIVALPDASARLRLAGQVNALDGFDVVACTSDLMETFDEVEHKSARVVLIAEVLSAQPEFEVMRGLFATLDVRWLVIHRNAGATSQAANGVEARADLFALHEGLSADQLSAHLRSVTRRAAAPRPAARPAHPARTGDTSDRLILIGASTGGVDALLTVISRFPVHCPPTLIVQHTGSSFGVSLSTLLDRQCAARVRLAEGRIPLRAGEIILGAGVRRHLVLQRHADGSLCAILEGETPVSGHLPSVDALFRSAVPVARHVAAALLTGMGRDGAEGMKALHDAGAFTIAQDRNTSVVYGMPRAAAELGAASEVMPLGAIGPALVEHPLPMARPGLRA